MIFQGSPCYLTFLGSRTSTEKYAIGLLTLYNICCSCAMEMRRASWKFCSSDQCGLTRCRISASRLWFRIQMVCITVNPGCSRKKSEIFVLKNSQNFEESFHSSKMAAVQCGSLRAADLNICSLVSPLKTPIISAF
jgi:hypothetical protein